MRKGRITSALLVFMMLFSMTSCKKKEKFSVTKYVQETDPFFSVQKAELSYPLDTERELESLQLEAPTLLGDLVAVVYHIRYKMTQEDLEKLSTLSDDEQWAFSQSFMRTGKALFDTEGKFIRELNQEDEEMSILGFQTTVDGADGKGYAVYNRSTDTGTHSYLCTLSDRGEPDEGILLNTYYFFTNESQIIVTKDGYILAGAPEAICIFRPDGSLINELTCDGCNGGMLVQDGKYYIKGYRGINPDDPFDTFEFVQEIDIAGGKLVGSEIQCTNEYLIIAGRNNSYRLDNNGVKKVDLLDSNNDRYVMEWCQTDYNPVDIDYREMKVISDDEFVFFEHIYGSIDMTGENTDTMTLVHMKRMDRNPYAGKPIIQMACYGNTSVMDYVVSYNTDANSKNRIILHDYSADVNPNWPPVQQSASAADTVYQAMISGDGPDILVNFGSFSQFNTDKVLVDLNTLIDAEESDIHREDYYDNILRAAETNGKLYQIPLIYSIEGLIGNADLLGEPTNWDCRTFCERMQTLPEDMRIFEEDQNKYFFPRMFSFSAQSLIDYETQQVRFDSDGFRDFLTLMKDYGELGTGFSFSNSWELYAENMEVFIPAIIESLESYARYMNIRKGNDDVYPVPSVGEKGLAADVKLTMAISKFSPHQEEAWEFIRFMMDRDEQIRLGEKAFFPIHKEALEICNQKHIEQFAEQQLKRTETRQVGHSFDVTAETAQAVVELVERISCIRATDPDILNIIMEEAPGYFTGQRTLDDVVQTIQNRAKTVVQER